MNDIHAILNHPNSGFVAVTAISAISISLALGYGIRSLFQSKPKNNNKITIKTDTKAVIVDNSDDSKILKGYKETTDGRKTTYFHRELSEEEKELIGDNTPKRIDSSNQILDNTPRLLSKSPSGSPWNSAGTYEEKDISQWVIPKLTKLFSDIQYSVNGQDINDNTCKSCSVSITNVSNVDGDAIFTVARGKKRYVLDMRADVDWKLACNGRTISGKYKLTNISSDGDFEIEKNTSSSISSDIASTYRAIILNESSRHSLQKKMKASLSKLYTEMKESFN